MLKCFIAVLFIIGTSDSLSSGTVAGKVLRRTVQDNAVKINRYSGRESVPASSSESEPASSQTVVYLTGGPKSDAKPPQVRPKMVQQDQAFYPEVLPILVGTTVEFPNLDPVFHNVFSYSRAKKFDLGRYPKGHSKSVTFDAPGLVKVFCEIHSSMRAHILVLEQPYFTLAEADGNYRIENVSPGNYVLKVWQEQLPELEYPIQVKETEVVLVDPK